MLCISSAQNPKKVLFRVGFIIIWDNYSHYFTIFTNWSNPISYLFVFCDSSSLKGFSHSTWPCQLGLQNTQTASLQRGQTPHTSECHRYDTKQSDGEAPVMLELWGMWSAYSVPSLPSPLRPGVVAFERVLSMGQIELNCVLRLNWIVCDRTVHMYKMDLRLITYSGWCVIKPNQSKPNLIQQFSNPVVFHEIPCSWVPNPIKKFQRPF